MDALYQVWHYIEQFISVLLGRSFVPDPDFRITSWLFSRGALIIVFVTLLEFAFPLERRKFGRRNVLTLTYFFLAAKAGVFVVYVIPLIRQLWVTYGLPTLNLDQRLPIIVYGAVALLVVNFVDYWAHRTMHRVPLLWHIHKIHHATEKLNWGSNYHRHFAMPVVAAPLITVTTLLLGTHLVPPFGLIHMTVEHLQHSNIRIRFRWLNYLLALPEVHRYHHSKDPKYYDKNFAGGFVIWDQIFRTYHYDPKAPATDDFGLNEPVPKDYFGQQIAPLVWIARDVAKKLPSRRLRTWGHGPAQSGAAPDAEQLADVHVRPTPQPTLLNDSA